ncbi:MAG: hypothetical protein KC618_08505, partial [Candidatus Omnitrophica bacterium]|nr:hypothetical protein [Candidatus Omnitrophota bacterium]
MGITADLSQIKILAQTDVEGTTLYGLKKAAEYYGLQAMGMKLSYEELRAYLQRGYHAIAFVNNDHYVYIKKDHPEGIVYKDVAPGFQFAVDYQWRKIWYEEEKEQGVVLIIN